MSLLGEAALALWWDVLPEVRAELEHWHAHEHFPERLAVPGFLRGSRWTAVEGGEGFFVMYELQDHGVLASPAYVARLNAPSPWSTRMMPQHRHMVRAQCQVVHSRGAVTARHALTIRCSPAEGQAQALEHRLAELSASIPQQPGVVGLHMLRHEAPRLAPTTEEAIRGHADRAADWVVVACGYELEALHRLGRQELGEASLHAAGAAPDADRQFFGLAYAAVPADVR